MKFKKTYFTLTETVVATAIVASTSGMLAFFMTNCYEMYQHTQADKSLLQQSAFLHKRVSQGFGTNPGLAEVNASNITTSSDKVFMDTIKAVFDRSEETQTLEGEPAIIPVATVSIEERDVLINFYEDNASLSTEPSITYREKLPVENENDEPVTVVVKTLSKTNFAPGVVVDQPVVVQAEIEDGNTPEVTQEVVTGESSSTAVEPNKIKLGKSMVSQIMMKQKNGRQTYVSVQQIEVPLHD